VLAAALKKGVALFKKRLAISPKAHHEGKDEAKRHACD
jgi:hypothetical protein